MQTPAASLAAALGDVMPAILKTSSVEALKHVHLEPKAGALVFTASGAHATLRATVPVPDCHPGRAVLVLPGVPQALLKNTPGDVDVQVGDILRISSASLEMRHKILSEESWPGSLADHQPAVAAKFQIDGDALLVVFRRVAMASGDEDRHFDAVVIQASAAGLELTAMDGHRLHRESLGATTGLTQDLTAQVPAAALRALMTAMAGRLCDVSVSTERMYLSAGAGLELWVALHSNAVPPYQKVIEPALAQLPTAVLLSRDALLEAVRRSRLGASATCFHLSVEKGSDLLRLRGHAPAAEGSESTETVHLTRAVQSESIEVSLNPSYLADALESMEAGSVIRLAISSPTTPTCVVPESSTERIAIVMPQVCTP
jgi:DNA polymerase III sliding clamp (beta) subunit (PCNA family)